MKVLASSELEQVQGGSSLRGAGTWIRDSLDRARATVARDRNYEY